MDSILEKFKYSGMGRISKGGYLKRIYKRRSPGSDIIPRSLPNGYRNISKEEASKCKA